MAGELERDVQVTLAGWIALLPFHTRLGLEELHLPPGPSPISLVKLRSCVLPAPVCPLCLLLPPCLPFLPSGVRVT